MNPATSSGRLEARRGHQPQCHRSRTTSRTCQCSIARRKRHNLPCCTFVAIRSRLPLPALTTSFAHAKVLFDQLGHRRPVPSSSPYHAYSPANSSLAQHCNNQPPWEDRNALSTAAAAGTLTQPPDRQARPCARQTPARSLERPPHPPRPPARSSAKPTRPLARHPGCNRR